MVIEKANWDSDFFEYPVGKIFVSEPLDSSGYSSLIEQSRLFRLVYIFAQEPIEILQPHLADIKTVFKVELKESIEPIHGIIEFDAGLHSYEALEALAFTSGEYSRFKLDGNFKSNEFEKLYKTWILKSLSKELANHIFIKVSEDGNIMGFITLKFNDEKEAEFGLLAVSSDYRGQGLGRLLINHCKYVTLSSGRNSIIVPTQWENEPAKKLYENSGFSIIQKTYTYHIWNL